MSWEQSRIQVQARCHGMCEGCGAAMREVHHRQPRGMGGVYGAAAETAHATSNLMGLCPGCHRFTETDPEQARQLGWLVRHGVSSRSVPARMVTVNGVGWFRLDDEAGYHWVDEGTALFVVRLANRG